MLGMQSIASPRHRVAFQLVVLKNKTKPHKLLTNLNMNTFLTFSYSVNLPLPHNRTLLKSLVWGSPCGKQVKVTAMLLNKDASLPDVRSSACNRCCEGLNAHLPCVWHWHEMKTGHALWSSEDCWAGAAVTAGAPEVFRKLRIHKQ